jgi:hypothetical protein
VFGILEIRTLLLLFIGVEFELFASFFVFARFISVNLHMYDLLLFCMFESIYFLLAVEGNSTY